MNSQITEATKRYFVQFYNDSNLGDDLFLETLVQRFPKFNFYLHIHNNAPPLNSSFLKYKNLHCIDTNFTYKTISSEISKYDGFVLIGGSIFQDLSYVFYRGYIGRYLMFRKLFQADKKVYILGSNLGPFNTLFGRFIFKNTLKFITHISVRDSYSHQLLKLWGIRNVIFAPDIVFCHDFKPKLDTIKNKNILGISILNTKLNLEVQGTYIAKMAELVNEYLNLSSNNKVRLFAFDGGHEDDGAIIDLIIKNVNYPSRVVKVVYNQDITIDEYLKLFVECGYVVTNRFHSMILAVKLGIPFFPIIYSKKTTDVLDDLKFSFDSIKYSNIKTLDLAMLLKNIVQNSGLLNVSEAICLESEKHFLALDEVYFTTKEI